MNKGKIGRNGHSATTKTRTTSSGDRSIAVGKEKSKKRASDPRNQQISGDLAVKTYSIICVSLVPIELRLSDAIEKMYKLNLIPANNKKKYFNYWMRRSTKAQEEFIRTINDQYENSQTLVVRGVTKLNDFRYWFFAEPLDKDFERKLQKVNWRVRQAFDRSIELFRKKDDPQYEVDYEELLKIAQKPQYEQQRYIDTINKLYLESQNGFWREIIPQSDKLVSSCHEGEREYKLWYEFGSDITVGINANTRQWMKCRALVAVLKYEFGRGITLGIEATTRQWMMCSALVAILKMAMLPINIGMQTCAKLIEITDVLLFYVARGLLGTVSYSLPIISYAAGGILDSVSHSSPLVVYAVKRIFDIVFNAVPAASYAVRAILKTIVYFLSTSFYLTRRMLNVFSYFLPTSEGLGSTILASLDFPIARRVINEILLFKASKDEKRSDRILRMGNYSLDCIRKKLSDRMMRDTGSSIIYSIVDWLQNDFREAVKLSFYKEFFFYINLEKFWSIPSILFSKRISVPLLDFFLTFVYLPVLDSKLTPITGSLVSSLSTCLLVVWTINMLKPNKLELSEIIFCFLLNGPFSVRSATSKALIEATLGSSKKIYGRFMFFIIRRYLSHLLRKLIVSSPVVAWCNKQKAAKQLEQSNLSPKSKRLEREKIEVDLASQTEQGKLVWAT